MKALYDLLAKQDAAITKEAFVAPLVRGVSSLGKAVLRRPMVTGGAALTGMDLASGSKRFTNMTSATRANPYRPPRM